jgi:peptidoglycan lytic transglycosylase
MQGEEGIASWYGHPFHGRKSASGEIYNMYAMTAAHRTLPFGTLVRVHNLENGKSVVVRITDRGPFVEGRIIDLSYAAAQAIGMSGTALVRLEILGYGSGQTAQTGAGPPPGTFAVQVGAFQDPRNAERLRDRIAHRYRPVSIVKFDHGDGVFYRVLVGSVSSEQAANELARNLRNEGFAAQTFIVRTD